MTGHGDLSRRSFLKTSTALSAAVAFPAIIPSSALGADGHVAPSNRIVMGAIGTGSRGTGNTMNFAQRKDVQIVAVCDVDKVNLDAAKKKIDGKYKNTDCQTYCDYRELIGRGDLDAVTIATPDHWHALLAVAAANAGLDIFGEKPLARSIKEGRAICDAVQKHGRIWQTGSWQRSKAEFRFACELVRNGRIGKVRRAEVGLPTGKATGLVPELPVPDTLDWNSWLGPAPWAPYRDFAGTSDRRRPGARCHWNWRWILDYSGGQLTDWAGHHIDIAHWGLGFDHTGPVQIEGKGDYPTDGLWTTPMTYKFNCKYANGIDMTVANDKQVQRGATWYGDQGWIRVSRGILEAEPKSLLDEVIGSGEIRLYESNDHYQNFIDCVKTRKQTITPVEVAQRSISVGLLGEIAMLTGRKIKWNPEKEEIRRDPSASALLGRSYREPWHL